MKDDISEYFDYNLVKPRHVNEGTIDYFQYSLVGKDEEENKCDFITLKEVLTQNCSVGELTEQYQGHSYSLDRLKSIHMDLLFQCDEILKLCEEKSYTSAIEELEKLRLNLGHC